MNKVFSLLLFLFSVSLVSQNETNNWYFGNKAAIKFENGRIIILDDSEMNTPANSTSISDENGNLLFYADGTTIWNKNHEIMENGNDLFGENTLFQSTIIIPKPSSTDTYYLFYSRQSISPDLKKTIGTYYAEIRFSSAFPLGTVIEKDIKISSNSPAEKMTAVHHKNGESIWLIIIDGLDTNSSSPKKKFKVFSITENGIDFIPIEKNVGFDIENFGSMKISPSGKKLFITSNTENNALRFLHEYAFDTDSGNLTFINNFILENTFAVWPSKGIEFSPNEKFIYISYKNGNNNGIIQYQIEDIELFDEPRVFLFSSNSIKIESLQISSDQKIYVALNDEENGHDFLGVIEKPDEKGMLASYKHNAIRLAPNASKKGLPNFIQSYFASKIFTENVCYIDEFSFSATSFAPIKEISWDFGDGNTSTEMNPKHRYNSPDNYIVKATLSIANQKITITKIVSAFAIPVIIPNQELVACDEDLDGLSTFNLKNIRDKILSRGSTENTDFYLRFEDISSDTKISTPDNFQNTIPNQEIFVKVTNENGCFEIGSFFIRTRFIQLNDIPTVFVCEDSDGISGNAKGQFDVLSLESHIRSQLTIASNTRLSFYPTFENAQTSTNNYTGIFSEISKTIYLKIIEADQSCGGIKAFQIVVNSEPIINLQEEYTICFDPSSKPPIIISGDLSNQRFEWKDSAGNITRTRNFTLNMVGEFSLTVYKTENNLECSNTKTFRVVNPNPPEFSQIIVNTEDETNNIIEVFINGNSTYQFSLDNINFFGNGSSHTFSNVPAGLQTVFVRDVNSCEQPIERTVSVIGYKKYFTPNGDGNNDFWNIEGLDSNSFKAINVSIFDRFGKIIHSITDFTSLGWDGSFNGKNLPANNYWFKSEIIDKNDNLIEKSGNFSLIRN